MSNGGHEDTPVEDLAWSQVCPRDPGILQPWMSGTRTGTNPGFTSKVCLSKSLRLKDKDLKVEVDKVPHTLG